MHNAICGYRPLLTYATLLKGFSSYFEISGAGGKTRDADPNLDPREAALQGSDVNLKARDAQLQTAGIDPTIGTTGAVITSTLGTTGKVGDDFTGTTGSQANTACTTSTSLCLQLAYSFLHNCNDSVLT